MKYPDQKWCNHCKTSFCDLERLAIDVSGYFNLNPELAWVCSQKCEDALIKHMHEKEQHE